MLPYLPEIKKSMLKNILKGEWWRFNFERIRSVNYVAKLRVETRSYRLDLGSKTIYHVRGQVIKAIRHFRNRKQKSSQIYN